MATDWDKEFEAIADQSPEFYPGSTKAIVRHPNRVPDVRKVTVGEDPEWDANPHTFEVNGVPTAFFTVGQLARALGRRPVTIRKWERDGVLPKAIYQIPGRDDDVRGRRRLYTREQVEGVVKIAAEEGHLVSTRKPFSETKFVERVRALFVVHA